MLPSKEDVAELLTLSQQLDVAYNIHLPLDLSLTRGSMSQRQKACDTLLKVIDLFAPVAPTTYTLHLDMAKEIKRDLGNSAQLKRWEERAGQSLDTIVSKLPHPECISIETLDYPFFLVESLVDQFDLSVCLDVGHQIKYGYNLLETYEKHQSRVTIIHLHGVSFSEPTVRDHTGLDLLPEKYFRQIQTILNNFQGVVSLEVFNLENLNRSLSFLSKPYGMTVPDLCHP